MSNGEFVPNDEINYAYPPITINRQGTLMEIYVGNVPSGSRPGDIRKLIKAALKKKVFPRMFEKMLASGQIDKGVGIKIRKSKTPQGEYSYGHVVVHSSGLGRLTMDSLKNAELRGTPLNAREFVIRDRDNERRAANGHKAPRDFPCRRRQERRQKGQ